MCSAVPTSAQSRRYSPAFANRKSSWSTRPSSTRTGAWRRARPCRCWCGVGTSNAWFRRRSCRRYSSHRMITPLPSIIRLCSGSKQTRWPLWRSRATQKLPLTRRRPSNSGFRQERYREANLTRTRTERGSTDTKPTLKGIPSKFKLTIY